MLAEGIGILKQWTVGNRAQVDGHKSIDILFGKVVQLAACPNTAAIVAETGVAVFTPESQPQTISVIAFAIFHPMLH